MRSHRRAPVALLFLLAFTRAPQAAGQLLSWQTFGPPLFQVNAVAAANGADPTVYAGASIYEVSQSAIFASSDAGKTWLPLVEAPSGEFYSEILVDPRDARRIYAGALNNAGTTSIYRSTDSGTTWSPSHTVSSYCVPSFAPDASAEGLLMSCGTRVFRSADAGGSWDELASSFTQPVRLATGPDGGLFTYDSKEIFRSTNAGSSWTPVAAAPPACPGINVLRVDPTNAKAFLVGAGLLGAGGFQCGGVFRSSDSGATWDATGFSKVYVTDVAFDTASPSSVYASASYIAGILPKGGVYESSDGGRTWRDLRIPALGAVRLALSASGHLLHAATSTGAFEIELRKPRFVAPRANP